MTQDIYIASIDKYISMKEFKSHLPKVGHVYRLNPHYLQKCIGYDGNTPIMEGLVVLSNINNGTYQLHLYPKDNTNPSLDFVNAILGGRFVEVDAAQYDSLVTAFKNSSAMLADMCNSIH